MKWADWFYYDETSLSHLSWGCDVGTRARTGCTAGCLDNGYYRVMLSRKSYLVSRIIWEMFNGEIPDGYIIDHFDGDRGNNKLSNLRCIEDEFNPRNSKKRDDNKTGITGICERVIAGRRYYAAQWMHNSKVCGKYLNRDTLGDEEALRLVIVARDNAILKLNQLGAGYTARHGT